MKITYSITVCNEFIEIQTLVRHLLKCKRPQDNIVILYDESNGDKEIETYLRSHSVNGEFSWHKGKFNRNFAEWKNKLNSYCSGDFIFNLDADEIPDETLLEYLPQIIGINPEVDAYWVPRINTLGGDEYEIDQYTTMIGWRTSSLPSMIEEDTLDLDNPEHLKRYNFLKENDFLIEESRVK